VEAWAHWKEPTATLWPHLADFSISEDADRLIAIGPLLPTPNESRLVQLSIYRASPDTPGRCTLYLTPAPLEPAPDSIRQHDSVIGGQLGLWERLTTAWKDQGPPATAVHASVFRMEGKHWKCLDLPRPLSNLEGELRVQKLANEGNKVLVEQIGFRLENGSEAIEEISIIYEHAYDRYLVKVLGRGLVNVENGKWLPYADAIRTVVISTLFGGATNAD
jgi:hypothetical protein